MSADQNSFINAYVDHSVNMLHDYVNQVLQLKTQLTIANGVIKQKDDTITSIKSELESNKNTSDELNQSNNKFKQLEAESNQKIGQLEQELNALRNKVTHMDTLTNQLNSMKHDLIVSNEEKEKLQRQSDEEKEKLLNQIIELKDKNKSLSAGKVTSKKVINTKNMKPPVVETKPTEEADDF